ncbi:MAG: ATP-grasp domain-containing protein [Gammaproteobacteria bacterium]
MTSKTVLITLGRLPKALELTRGLKRAGCRVIVAEPFDWHVCRLSNSVDACYSLPAPTTDPAGYRRELLELIERENVDLVVPVSEETLHVLDAKVDAPSHVSFYSPSRETIVSLHDKLRFSQDARDAGFDVPETWSAQDPRAKALALRTDVIVKPAHGCSGVGVRHVRAGQSFEAEVGDIVQRFVEGRHVSTFTIAHEGDCRETVMYEATLLSGSVAVCFRRVDHLPAVTRWVQEFVAARELSGFVSFDFIVDAEQTAWAIECNPRMTSGVHFLRCQDVAQAILQPAVNAPIELRKKAHFQQFYPALTETYKKVFSTRTFLRRTRTIWSARDVVFSWRDLKPFFLMTPASWPILRQTLFDQVGFGEAATRDIIWTAPVEKTDT